MMVVLKAMENQGLVTRLPRRRHQNVLELHITDAGQEVLSTAGDQVEPIERRMTNAFTARELKALIALLKRITDAAEPPR